MSELDVCLINDSFPPAIDGVANAVTNYGAVISSGLGRATVVTPYYPDADDSIYNYPVIRYPSIDMTKLVGYRAGMPFDPKVMEKLEKSGFDIIHSHCPITSTMLARALRDRVDIPIVMTYHTKFDIDIANAIRGRLLREEAAKILVKNISACDEVWTVSKGAGENLKSLGYEGDYIVMPNGVDFPQGRVRDEMIEAATADFNLPSGIPLFLFVGRMMWYKGIKIILDALRILDGNGTDFRMVFIGGGGDKEEITAYCEKLQLGDKVFFSEPVRDRNIIRAWYCRADLFLFPSSFDTNGLVVREAAACGLASVLVRGSCAAEDVTDGINGFLIEENPQSMAAKLEEVLQRRELLWRTGERAQRDLYMSWDESVKRAYSRYSDVTDNYKRGLYPAREELTDEFFHGMAELMDAIIRAEKRRENLRDGIISDISGLKCDLNSEFKRAKDEYLKEEAALREDIARGRAKLKNRIDEINQHINRFM